MLKITLPNGVVIEGDANDLGLVVQNIIATPKEKVNPVEVQTVPTESVESIKCPDTINSTPERKEVRPVKFPHIHVKNDYRAITLGARQDQALQAGKLIAEQANDKSKEFTTREVMEVINDGLTIWSVGNALQGLYAKGLVRHGRHSRCWYVTERGWVSRYRVTRSVGPTT